MIILQYLPLASRAALHLSAARAMILDARI